MNLIYLLFIYLFIYFFVTSWHACEPLAVFANVQFVNEFEEVLILDHRN